MGGDGLADNLSVNGLVGNDPDGLAGMPLQHPVEKDEFAALLERHLGALARVQGDDASTRQLLTRHALKANRDGQRPSRRAAGLLLDDARAESVALEGRIVVVQGDADVADLLGATAAHRHLDDGGGDFLEGGTTVDEAVSSALDADAAGAVGQGDARPVCQADARRIEGDEVVRRLQVLAEDVAALLHGDGTPARDAALFRSVIVGGFAVLEEETVVGGHEDAGDVRGDKLAYEAGELVDSPVDRIRGWRFPRPHGRRSHR